MRPGHSWAARLPFFVDPKLRAFDKDLYRNVLSDLEGVGARWTEDLSLLASDEKLPTVFILVSDTNLDPDVRDMDKVLIVGDANMSIFGKKEFSGENFSVNSSADWSRFFSDVSALFKRDFIRLEGLLLERSLDKFRTLVKRGNKFDFDAGKMFISLEEELLSLLSEEEIIETLPKASKEHIGVEFNLLLPAMGWGRENVLPLKGKNLFYLSWDGPEKGSLALKVYSLLEDILARDFGDVAKAESLAESLEDMQHILSELPLPLALFNENQELVLHNAAFIRLNITAKNVLALGEGHQFNQNGELYRVNKRLLEDSGHELYTFAPVKEFLRNSSSPSSEELGIISSSIAHELNNPLGGVSGALDVILLDAHPAETEQSLRDMKESVSRCKKLVETFLGFSKLEAAKSADDGNCVSVEACLNSAMELVRFRLIENNVNMDTNFHRLKKFRPKFNPHVMSMTLYLIIGDLLTSFGHKKLVAGEKSAHFNLNFLEDSTSLAFSSLENLGLDTEFLKSKLLNHLLEIQNLRIESRPEAVILSGTSN